MSRPVLSTTIVAAVRAYFGLTQDDLAQYLGVSRAAVSHAEAGRRHFGTAVWLRLLPLAELLPPDAPAPGLPAALAAPQLPPGPPAALAEPPVRRRLRHCAHEAQQLRHTLESRYAAGQQARRWQQALPGLLALLPATPAADSRWQQRQRRWLATHSAEMADKLDAASLTDYQLLALRLHYLEQEAAELRRWLPDTSG